MTTAKALYDSNDPIGLFLSNLRLGAVTPLIHGKVVDLACGDNRLVLEYRRRGGEGWGVDINDHGADIVTQEFHNLSRFESESIDTVTIIASINYFPEPDPVLREVRRLLKRDGRVLVTMSNAAILKVWHLFREPWAHKSGLTKQEMISLFKKAGFRLRRRKMFMFGLNFVYEFERAD